MRTTICDRCGRDCTHEDIEIVFGKELCSLCQKELSEWLEKKSERSKEITSMDEYISRKDILDIVSQYCTDDDGSCSKADVDLREVLDEIEALPAADIEPVDRWISVDYKLPECDETVVVWYASDTLFGVIEGYGLSWYHHGSWHLNDLNGENIRILYWQYIFIEPPKDSEQNDT